MSAQRTGCHPPRTGLLAQAGSGRIPVLSASPQGRARCGLEPPESPFLASKTVDRPILSPRPLSAPSSPPLAAAVTKRSSRIAVLVRPPLPTARGGSRGASSLAGIPRLHEEQGPSLLLIPDSRLPLLREPHPALSARLLSLTPGRMHGGSGPGSLGF